MEELLTTYIDNLKTQGDPNETYKWEAINHFQEQWNIQAPDFAAMFLEAFKKKSNLMYQNSWGFIKKAVTHFPEEVRQMFQELYNETIPLKDRIETFQQKAETLVTRVKEATGKKKFNAQQDERTLSVYLAFRFPEKYFLYKSSFYDSLCNVLNVPTEQTGQRYIHYMTLAEEVKRQYIAGNEALQKIHQNIYPKTTWNDDNLITQNFLYNMLEKDDLETSDDESGVEKIPAYYCVGFHFYSKEYSNQLARFVSEGIWENGYADKFLDRVKSVPEGALLAAKTSYTMNEDDQKISVLEIHAIGKVLKNTNDGRRLIVDWKMEPEPFILKGKGAYRSTINQVVDPENIKLIFHHKNETPTDIKPKQTVAVHHPLNQILYGPPGTGKTYKTVSAAVKIVNPEFYRIHKKDRKAIKQEYDRLLIKNWSEGEGQIAFCTFHQSFTYEDFVEGIKPEIINEKDIVYGIQKGLFRLVCDRARTSSTKTSDFDAVVTRLKNDILNNGPITLSTDRGNKFDVNYTGQTTFRIRPHESSAENPQYPAAIENIRMLYEGAPLTDLYNPSYVKGILEHLYSNYNLPRFSEIKNSNKPYVLIIDEINRGNVSSIFGELITLIEPDKRAGATEGLEVILPYSKLKFGVPKNVHIIGTMNTADRSVEALDTALRRRFSFVEMPPQPEKIKAGNGREEMDGIHLPLLLTIINRRIEKLLDKDHMIGHSYFMGLHTRAQLKQVFHNKVLPLLQEYFFGDFGKIGLILGEGFFEKTEKDETDIFASFGDYDSSSLMQRNVYHLKKVSKMTDAEFMDALSKTIS